MPDVPYLHQMSGAARDDEHGKTEKNPTKLGISALMNEVKQGNRNGIVGGGDKAVRNDMQPDHDWIPLVAHAMRHESVRRKESLEETHHKEKTIPGSTETERSFSQEALKVLVDAHFPGASQPDLAVRGDFNREKTTISFKYTGNKEESINNRIIIFEFYPVVPRSMGIVRGGAPKPKGQESLGSFLTAKELIPPAYLKQFV